MGIRTDIRDEIRKETVTKIHGQPTSHDLMQLEKEIIAILANIPTRLGGGNYGHVGVIMDPAEYNTMTAGIDFENPVNPGFYPADLALNAAAEHEPGQKPSTKSSSTNSKPSKEFDWEPKTSFLRRSTPST